MTDIQREANRVFMVCARICDALADRIEAARNRGDAEEELRLMGRWCALKVKQSAIITAMTLWQFGRAFRKPKSDERDVAA